MTLQGNFHIAERPVDPIGQPSNSGATYENTSNNYDVAVAGLPFFIGPNQQYPYKRETAQYRKQQIDQQKEPGEQTLTGWWLRSQSSFHFGAGIRYEEPVQGETVGYRFNKSAGIDVFNIGQVTLLPDVTKKQSVTNTPKIIGGTDTNGVDVAIWSDGSSLYRSTYSGSPTTLIWGGSGNILAVAQDGVNYYAANATGIYKGPLTGATSGTLVFTHPTAVGTVTNVNMAWVKQRLIAGVNNYVYEVTPITTFNITGAMLATNEVTLTTDGTAHNFAVGSQVTVASISTAYNGTWIVDSVPNATSFTYYHNNTDVAFASVTGTAVLAANNILPIYAHPNPKWIWTGICEGPNAIYIGGYVGDSSSVYRLALDTSGTTTLPLLTKVLSAADMPKGEQLYALASYVGKYMVFGTSKGIRVGVIDTSGYLSSGFITYGPLTVVTNGFDPASASYLNGKPCKSIAFNDRYAYCTVSNYIDNGDGTFSSGLVKIDLSREITPNQMAYATHLRVPTTVDAAAVAVLGSSNRLVIGTVGDGIYFQSDALVSSGYLQTGQIRYFTLEDKHFELIKLRETTPMLGQLKLSTVDANGAISDIITVDNNFDFTQDVTGLDQQDLSPKESVGMRFTLYSAVGQTTVNADSFNGYQLKALPAVRRQRIITIPLLNYDFEADKNNMAVGYEGRAAERLTALEEVESGGDVVVLQDFTNGETVRGVIESLSFIRMTPPERRFTGFGGMVVMQFRTV